MFQDNNAAGLASVAPTGDVTGRASRRRDETAAARVFGPASLSNLGPGFDTLGLCIDGIGDVVEATLSAEPGVRITSMDGDGGLLPLHPDQNTASVAAQYVLRRADTTSGLNLRIEKRVPFGSGIGGSAASAVAGAWAANLALGSPLEKEDLVAAVLEGEAIASGSKHGDNVLPALFGGLVLTSASDPQLYRRIPLKKDLPIALVTPDVQVLTKAARDILPKQVSFRDAIDNASDLAFLIDAFRCGDWETVGRSIMKDRLVEPVRATLVPCYRAALVGAMDAGAFGCALTGSGPAMFAIAESFTAATDVLRAMIESCRSAGIDATGRVTSANGDGVRVCADGQ